MLESCYFFLRSCGEHSRVNSCNAGITNEIVFVECQHVSDAVNEHRGYDPCIVDLDAHDRMNNYQAPPFRMNLCVIRQQRKCGLDESGAAIGFSNAQPITVLR